MSEYEHEYVQWVDCYGDHMTFRNPAQPLAPEQAELRRRVLALITTHPERFYMGDWVAERYASDDEHGTHAHICGTTLCLAGHAVVLSGLRTPPPDVTGMREDDPRMLGFLHYQQEFTKNTTRDAAMVLGLTQEEYTRHDENGLFYTSDELAVAWLREITPE